METQTKGILALALFSIGTISMWRQAFRSTIINVAPPQR